MIKKLIRGIGAMAVCLFLFPLSALAADKSVTLSETGDEVQVFVELPSETKVEPITSLQMEFQVEITQGNAEQAKAEFHFNETIKSSVKEYRYHADTGILTIYISGKNNLFSEKYLSGQKLELGKLTVHTEDALGVKAKISVVKDSYHFVRKNGTKTETEFINAPGFAEIIVGNGGEETPTPDPEEEGNPTPDPEEEGNPTPDPEEEGNPTPDPEEEENPTPNPEQEDPTIPEQKPSSKPQSGEGTNSNVTSGTSENQNSNNSAATGDSMHPAGYILLAAVSAAILILVIALLRRKRRNLDKF